jgi:hypothetical protein
MKPLKAAATFVMSWAAVIACLYVVAAPFNWFNGQDPEDRVGNYLVHQLGGDAGDVAVVDCRPARESPTAERSALFDCAIEAEEPVELELEGGGFVRLDEGQVSLCFTIPSARKPRSFLAPEPARLVRVGQCPRMSRPRP